MLKRIALSFLFCGFAIATSHLSIDEQPQGVSNLTSYRTLLSTWEDSAKNPSDTICEILHMDRGKVIAKFELSQGDSMTARKALQYIETYFNNVIHNCFSTTQEVPATKAILELLQNLDKSIIFSSTNGNKKDRSLRLDADDAREAYTALLLALRLREKSAGFNGGLIAQHDRKLEKALRVLAVLTGVGVLPHLRLTDPSVPEEKQKPNEDHALKLREELPYKFRAPLDLMANQLANEPICGQQITVDVMAPAPEFTNLKYYLEDKDGKLTELKGPITPPALLVVELPIKKEKSRNADGLIEFHGPNKKILEVEFKPLPDNNNVLRGKVAIGPHEVSGDFKAESARFSDTASNRFRANTEELRSIPVLSISNKNEDTVLPQPDLSKFKYYLEDNEGKLHEVKGPITPPAQLVIEVPVKKEKSKNASGSIHIWSHPKHKFLAVDLKPLPNNNNVLRGKLAIGPHEANGDFDVTSVSFQDTASNQHNIYDGAELKQIPTLSISNNNEDIVPPAPDLNKITYYLEDKDGKLTELKGPITPPAQLVVELPVKKEKSKNSSGLIHFLGPGGKVLDADLKPRPDNNNILTGRVTIGPREVSGVFEAYYARFKDTANNEFQPSNAELQTIRTLSIDRDAETTSLSPVKGVVAESLKKLIQELGSDVFKTRERAENALMRSGEAAARLLYDATINDPDPEIRFRAGQLIPKLRNRILGP